MKRYTMFVVPALALLMATSVGAQNIPEPNGQYSIARHGSFAACLNPAANYAAESCSAHGVFVYPITDIAVGSITYASGSGCGTRHRGL